MRFAQIRSRRSGLVIATAGNERAFGIAAPEPSLGHTASSKRTSGSSPRRYNIETVIGKNNHLFARYDYVEPLVPGERVMNYGLSHAAVTRVSGEKAKTCISFRKTERKTVLSMLFSTSSGWASPFDHRGIRGDKVCPTRAAEVLHRSARILYRMNGL